MGIVLGIIFIIAGVVIFLNPDFFLRMEDSFRIKGERTYSDTAIMIMKLRGVLSIVIGIIFLFIKV